MKGRKGALDRATTLLESWVKTLTDDQLDDLWGLYHISDDALLMVVMELKRRHPERFDRLLVEHIERGPGWAVGPAEDEKGVAYESNEHDDT